MARSQGRWAGTACSLPDDLRVRDGQIRSSEAASAKITRDTVLAEAVGRQKRVSVSVTCSHRVTISNAVPTIPCTGPWFKDAGLARPFAFLGNSQ